MAAGPVVAFWGVALLLIAVPGADWAFTVSAGLRGRSVVPAVTGLVIGYAGMTVVVAAGVGALVAERPRALTVLTVVGGGYLMWHGVRTLAAPVPPVGVPAEAARDTPTTAWRTLAQGIGVSGLNPKGLLIFVALLPRFTNPDGTWPLTVQLGVLGLVFVGTCALFYLALGSVVRGLLRSRPAAAGAVSRLSGAGMVAIGAFLIVD